MKLNESYWIILISSSWKNTLHTQITDSKKRSTIICSSLCQGSQHVALQKVTSACSSHYHWLYRKRPSPGQRAPQRTSPPASCGFTTDSQLVFFTKTRLWLWLWLWLWLLIWNTSRTRLWQLEYVLVTINKLISNVLCSCLLSVTMYLSLLTTLGALLLLIRRSKALVGISSWGSSSCPQKFCATSFESVKTQNQTWTIPYVEKGHVIRYPLIDTPSMILSLLNHSSFIKSDLLASEQIIHVVSLFLVVIIVYI